MKNSINKSKKNVKGLALVQVALAVAIGSVMATGVVYHFHSIHQHEAVLSDASTIVAYANSSVLETKKVNHPFQGQTFTSANAFAGKVVVNTSHENCAQLKAQLQSAGVAGCNYGDLSFTSANYQSAFDGVSVGAVQALADPNAGPKDAITNVDLVGTPLSIPVATFRSTVQSGPPTGASFTYVANHNNGTGNVNGGKSGTVDVEAGAALGSQNVPPPSTGNATINPPEPPVTPGQCPSGPSFVGSSATFSNPHVKSMDAGNSAWTMPATGTSCGPTSASGSFTLSYLGQNTVVTVHCSGLDPVNHTATDVCDIVQIVDFAGASFQVSLDATSRFRQDVVYPGLCPASASMNVVQLSKTPGC